MSNLKPNIFNFWSDRQLDEFRVGEKFIHPYDQEVLERVGFPHFEFKCLPSPFSGALHSAKVILLYLNPGLSDRDYEISASKSGQERFVRKLSGHEPLWAEEDHPSAWMWLKSRTKRFDVLDSNIREKLAILNVGCYHSKSLKSRSFLASLPSSRMTLEWAQKVLFPEAIQRKRLVICMRAAPLWGLSAGENGWKNGFLYAPLVNKRSGHFLESELRNEIISEAKKLLS